MRWMKWKSKHIYSATSCEFKIIYNVNDETGLFFWPVRIKSLFKKDNCIGGKIPKEKYTVLLYNNLVRKIEKPFVIGKKEKSRCLENINI